MMNREEEFKDIRPYRDHEFQQVMQELTKHPAVEQLVSNFFPNLSIDEFKSRIQSFPTIFDFQKNVLHEVVLKILDQTAKDFTVSGIDNISVDQQYLYISNHRDITLDPSLITTALVENGFHNSPEVAIGDNLIKEPWIRELLRITKSFIVKRNLPPRELIVASKKLSEYIHYVITERKNSVWIAQREGRAKDGNDITQPGLISMIAMSARGDLFDHFEQINIVPVSISYEYDPCDEEKARSLYGNRYLGGYKKSHREDEQSMRNGIVGWKGNIHIHFGKPIIDQIRQMPSDEPKKETIAKIRHLVDEQIVSGYKLWPNNYIARDLFEKNKPDFNHYTREQQTRFSDIIQQKLGRVEGVKEKYKMIFYEMYARPAINKSILKEKGSLVY